MNLLHAVSTKDLIAELTRRKRIRVLAVNTGFFNANAEDVSFTSAMDHELVRQIARVLNNKLFVAFKDEVCARDNEDRPTRSTRTASLMVLIPEGVDDGEDR